MSPPPEMAAFRLPGALVGVGAVRLPDVRGAPIPDAYRRVVGDLLRGRVEPVAQVSRGRAVQDAAENKKYDKSRSTGRIL